VIQSKISFRVGFGLASVPAIIAVSYGCSSSSSPPAATAGNDSGQQEPPTTEPDANSPTPAPEASTPAHDAGASDAGGISQKVTQTNLFADTAEGGAPHVDPNLVNPWGLAFNPGGVAWISDNGTGLATLYETTQSAPLGLVVQVPLPGGVFPEAGATPAAPSGQVFNPSATVADAGATGDFLGDLFIISAEDGTISGWASSFTDKTKAKIRVDNSASNAVYKGLVIVPSTPQVLIAADFHNGKIAVFDTNYAAVTPAAGKWVDATIPAGYAPFNVASIGTSVFVAYAKQDSVQHDDQAGPGNGAVSVFQTDGTLVKSLIAAGGVLNSPWALTTVPTGGWGALPAGALLVGDFGDGAVNAFNATTGAWIGNLVNGSGTPLALSGLWALQWGVNAPEAGTTPEQLYFTAGPNGESDGLYGYLTAQ
jgi:uncharacterized protein (TIGR03118 family)